MRLQGASVILPVDDVYEDLELWYPVLRLREEGARVVVAGMDAGRTYRGKHGYPAASDTSFADIRADDFDGLVIPGGFAPDKLRRDPRVLELTRTFDAAQKLVAYICHAGWIPISAGIVRGRTVTSTPGIRDDLVNAGAQWVDEAVVVDGHHVTSRKPADLPDFLREIITFLERWREAHSR